MHPLLVSKGFKPRRGKVFQCDNCGKDTYKSQTFIKNYKSRFCSQVCHLELMKKQSFRRNCEICGKVFFCQPCQIKYRNRQTCSIECRGRMKTKLAEQRRLTQPPTKHALDRRIRYSKKMEEWRIAIFKRDDFTCQFCRVRGTYLEADHIKPFAYFPELRFELSNGRTLCRPCHDTTKISAKKMREMYANA